ncbi:MAG: succinate dehydrogenase, hydrophobic membrane anchor protein [Deltaproteobacteria bacterium]|nr:succinate dehydrogenase, hydrophobic membrane anchor protein [Deltaproteobacteria bacterium]
MGLRIISFRSGSFNWYFQRISGLALAAILGFHFVVMHLLSEGAYDYQTIMERMASPAWKALDICFLVLALYHGMTGVKIVIDDYVHRAGWRNFACGLTWFLALSLLIYGTMIILSLQAPSVAG